ncbi:MAG: energy transducer TonB [Flavobacteriales bacterium]|nr:energy transducer TonB [Flavobacteriales bacterium]
MRSTLTLLLLCSGLLANAQHDTVPPQPIDIEKLPSNNGSLTRLESAAQFPGGHAALLDYLVKELRYPDAMRQAKVEGVVHVVFTVTDAGEVRNVRVKQGIPNGAALDEEAVRVVSAMPRWEPARVNSVTVPTEHALPVKFQLAP